MLLCGAFAASAGPRIGIGDPPTGTPVGLTFGFQSDQAGGGDFAFTNTSGVTFTSLDFFVSEPIGTAITCNPAAFFDSCEVTSGLGSGGTSLFDIGFEITSPSIGGVPNGTTFTVNLNDPINTDPNDDPNGAGQWGPNQSFVAVANQSAPEPKTAGMILAGLGFAILTAVRRRRLSVIRS